jgi:hypothetical protein
MAAETDFSKPPEEVLASLIKDTNPDMNFVPADVAFDDPQATSGGDALVRDTAVVVHSTFTGRYTGQKDVIYNRVQLTDVIRHNPAPMVERTFQGTLRDMVPIINERFGIDLKRTDIIDQVLPNVFGIVSATMQVSNTSLVYQGSVVLQIRRTMALDVGVTDRLLSPFTRDAATPAVTATDKILERASAEQVLLPYPLTSANVTLSAPQTVSVGGRDARVTITALTDQGFLGSVEVTYSRLNLATALLVVVDSTPETLGLVSEEPFTPQSLVDAINAELGTFLRLFDLETIVIPEMETGIITPITLTARSTSLGWRGTGTVEVATGIPFNAQLFHTLINTALPDAT